VESAVFPVRAGATAAFRGIGCNLAAGCSCVYAQQIHTAITSSGGEESRVSVSVGHAQSAGVIFEDPYVDFCRRGGHLVHVVEEVQHAENPL
jgi:hypothetical protein